MEEDRARDAMRSLWIAIAAAAVVDAVARRRKHGELFGFVPYDFRLPTVDRARRSMWDPRSSRVLTPTTFGVGWGVNLGRLARLAKLT